MSRQWLGPNGTQVSEADKREWLTPEGSQLSETIESGPVTRQVTAALDAVLQLQPVTKQITTSLDAVLEPAVATGVAFDGTDYITTSGSPVVDGHKHMASFWIKIDAAGNGTRRYIWANSGERYYCRLENDNRIRIRGRNNDDVGGNPTVIDIESTDTFTSADGWLHVLFAWDVTHTDSSRCWLYVNDLNVTNILSYTQQSTNAVDMGRGDWDFMARNNGADSCEGALQEFWVARAEDWLDLSLASNRRKFTDLGQPVDLGTDGSTPLGAPPPIYWNNPFSTFEINKGSFSQGSITLIGTLTDEGTLPQYSPPGLTITTTMDAALQAVGLTRSSSMDALLFAKSVTVETSLHALLSSRNQRTALLNALLEGTGQTQLDLDGLLQKTEAKSIALDARLLGLSQRMILLDALLEARNQQNVSLDGLLQEVGKTRNVALDAALNRLGITRQAAMDAVLKAVVAKAVSLDALLFRDAIKLGVSMDALLRIPGLSIGTAFDSVLLKEGDVKTVTFDSLIQAVGLTQQLAIDALLILTVARQVSFDSVLQSTAYNVNTGVAFGGSDYISSGPSVTTDGQKDFFSLWIKIDPIGEGTTREIFCNFGVRYCFRLEADGTFRLMGRSTASGFPLVLDVQSNRVYNSSDGWLHVLCSWDVSHTDSSRCRLYINDVDVTNVVTYAQQTTNDIDMSVGLYGFMAQFDGTNINIAAVQEYWWGQSGNWLDLTIEANRRKFSDSNGQPVALGADGSLPNGIQPTIYWNEFYMIFEQNKGSHPQSDLTLTGILDDEGTLPSYTPPGGVTRQRTVNMDAILNLGLSTRTISVALNALLQETDLVRTLALDGVISKDGIKIGLALDAQIRQLGNVV